MIFQEPAPVGFWSALRQLFRIKRIRFKLPYYHPMDLDYFKDGFLDRFPGWTEVSREEYYPEIAEPDQ